MALAPPPPLQMAAQPILPFFSLSTPKSVVVILAPDAPRGWPSATAPPCMFILSSLRPKSFMLARATTLNASLISKASTASLETLAWSSALGMAREGEVVNFDGCCAASPQPRSLARGVRLCCFSADSETKTSAAAPSESGDAFAAVTVPSVDLNAGRRVRVFASLNWNGM